MKPRTPPKWKKKRPYWKHVIIQHDEECFAIHEAHYDADHKLTGISDVPIFYGESVDSLVWTLKKMLKCASQGQVMTSKKYEELQGETFQDLYGRMQDARFCTEKE